MKKARSMLALKAKAKAKAKARKAKMVIRRSAGDPL